MAKSTIKAVGRPSWQPTDADLQKAEELAGKGLTGEQIAACLGIGKTTLYERIKDNAEFSYAIKAGKAKTVNYVTGKLMQLIDQGDKAAIFFYLKTQCGWRESSVSEVSLKKSEQGCLSMKYEEVDVLMKQRLAEILKRDKNNR